MPTRTWRQLSRLADAPPAVLSVIPHDPFLNPAWLGALESSGVVGPDTAWQPAHLLLERDGQPAALLPLYRKQDSRGEYVFDHAWAGAYERHGRDYYPKLVTAIPFTPVPGPRLLLAAGEQAGDWLPTVLQAIQELCAAQSLSGWHGLFVEEDWVAPALAAGFARREGCRFHWENPGYTGFDDFLGRLTSKKRKDLRRERRLLQEQGVRCRQLEGHEISREAWDFFYHCYVRTYHEHGQHPYLNRTLFQTIAREMPEQLMLVIAEDDAGPMASALFFRNGQTLYGRYWGSLRRADGLHFEVCYYQGMEYCMRRGLRDFDPGTQGEHKLLRGFAPRRTHSLHWLVAPEFQQAIKRFGEEEMIAVRRYAEDAASVLPYRQDAQRQEENRQEESRLKAERQTEEKP